MALDDAAFRQTMGSFVSGVTVVTTEHAGVRYGMTVSSFTSLSLQPQLLLVCITSTLPTYLAIVESKQFGVSILAADQAPISQQFASRQLDKFAGVAWHAGSLGLPLITGACATIECRLAAIHPGGDHAIVVGEIVTAHTIDTPPLVYARGSYRQLA
ncbi:MAG: flavin reductase family protein [Roseiflexaceae bacterium]|jgi:flavin reductase (DIM6/NTAB) family NADH-FMN oxidoreductase RutF|nr:flavin reductase family protein [Chloroflexaceae bacterium]MCE2851232.1 flavin reductase family protein [Chloroflexaceae bacterium]